MKISTEKGSDFMTTKTKGRVLPDLAAQKRIAELEAQVKTLEKASRAAIKVSSKGGVSVYGLGRFPVTLYKSQWDKLLGQATEIRAFIKANESKLAVKE
jgi:hypothetical protein